MAKIVGLNLKLDRKHGGTFVSIKCNVLKNAWNGYPDMHGEDISAVESGLVAIVADQFTNGSRAFCFMVDLE